MTYSIFYPSFPIHPTTPPTLLLCFHTKSHSINGIGCDRHCHLLSSNRLFQWNSTRILISYLKNHSLILLFLLKKNNLLSQRHSLSRHFSKQCNLVHLLSLHCSESHLLLQWNSHSLLHHLLNNRSHLTKNSRCDLLNMRKRFTH